jgi:hypothetical protein
MQRYVHFVIGQRLQEPDHGQRSSVRHQLKHGELKKALETNMTLCYSFC